jgi:hypothetical protein
MTIDAEIATLSNNDHGGGPAVASTEKASRDFSAVVITGFYYSCSFRELVRSRRRESGTVFVHAIPPPRFSASRKSQSEEKVQITPWLPALHHLPDPVDSLGAGDGFAARIAVRSSPTPVGVKAFPPLLLITTPDDVPA